MSEADAVGVAGLDVTSEGVARSYLGVVVPGVGRRRKDGPHASMSIPDSRTSPGASVWEPGHTSDHVDHGLEKKSLKRGSWIEGYGTLEGRDVAYARQPSAQALLLQHMLDIRSCGIAPQAT